MLCDVGFCCRERLERAMAPKRKYGADRLEEAVEEAVKARKEELKKEFESVLSAGFELNCRPYF